MQERANFFVDGVTLFCDEVFHVEKGVDHILEVEMFCEETGGFHLRCIGDPFISKGVILL